MGLSSDRENATQQRGMYQRSSPYMLIMNIRYHEYIFISDVTLIKTWSECIYACFIGVQLYHSTVHSSDYRLTTSVPFS